jgi:hypothetical protein
VGPDPILVDNSGWRLAQTGKSVATRHDRQIFYFAKEPEVSGNIRLDLKLGFVIIVGCKQHWVTLANAQEAGAPGHVSNGYEKQHFRVFLLNERKKRPVLQGGPPFLSLLTPKISELWLMKPQLRPGVYFAQVKGQHPQGWEGSGLGGKSCFHGIIGL